MDRMFETLRQEKSSKWFYLVCHKIIAKSTDSVVCERCLKWNHLSCTFFTKLRKVDIANLTYNLTTRRFDFE